MHLFAKLLRFDWMEIERARNAQFLTTERTGICYVQIQHIGAWEGESMAAGEALRDEPQSFDALISFSRAFFHSGDHSDEMCRGIRKQGVYRLVIFGAVVVVLCVAMPAGVMGVFFPPGRMGPAERFGRFIKQTFTRRLSKEDVGN